MRTKIMWDALAGVAIVFAIAATIVAFTLAHDPKEGVQAPWRMGDWATCRDGTQTYSRNPQYPLEPPTREPCIGHGGVRAYGVGKRLNER
jgi:hypothetical protein